MNKKRAHGLRVRFLFCDIFCLILTGSFSCVLFEQRCEIVWGIEGEPGRNLRDGKILLQKLFGMGNFDIVYEGARSDAGLFLEFRFEAGERKAAAVGSIFKCDVVQNMLMDIDNSFADLICLHGLELPGKQNDAIQTACKNLLSQSFLDRIGRGKQKKGFPQLIFQECVAMENPG